MKEFKIIENFKYVALSSPLKVFLDITNSCNLKCKFCYKKTKQKKSNINKVLKILEELKKANIIDVVMAGGEPFYTQDPIKIFNSAIEMDLGVGVVSNGTLLTEEITHRLPPGIDFTISFHAPNAEKYEELTGVAFSFEKVVNGLKNLNTVGIIPGILFTPTKYNKDQLFNTVKFLIDSNIQFSCVQVNRLIPEGKARKLWKELVINLDDYKELLDQMLKVKENWPDVRIETGDAVPFCAFEERFHDFFVRCDYGVTVVAIDEKGNVKRCPCRKEISGNIFEKPLQKIWSESESLIAHRNLNTLSEKCKKCSLFELCGGGCLCSSIKSCVHIDSYLNGNTFQPLTLPKPNTDYLKKKFTILPNAPKKNTEYIVRKESDRLLCIPIGVQKVFFDSIIPKNCKFPVLWINETDKEILNLVDGNKTVAEMSNEISSKHQMELYVAENIVKETIKSFIEYNYIGQ